MNFDVAMTDDVNDMATKHLLSFFAQGELQEDLCFGLWSPSPRRLKSHRDSR